jgi:hypothetical protein
MPVGEDPDGVAARGLEQADEGATRPRGTRLLPRGEVGDRLVGRVEQVRLGEVDDQLTPRVAGRAEHGHVVVAEDPAPHPQPADPNSSLR